MKGNARLIQDHVAELLHMPEDLAVAMGWKTEGDVGREAGVDDPLLSVLHPYVPKGLSTPSSPRSRGPECGHGMRIARGGIEGGGEGVAGRPVHPDGAVTVRGRS